MATTPTPTTIPEAINSSTEVWFLIAGADKAEPVSVAFSDDPYRLPVGRIAGRESTVWFIDDAAIGQLNFDELAD